jgi:hypothetical protein
MSDLTLSLDLCAAGKYVRERSQPGDGRGDVSDGCGEAFTA